MTRNCFGSYIPVATYFGILTIGTVCGVGVCCPEIQTAHLSIVFFFKRLTYTVKQYKLGHWTSTPSSTGVIIVGHNLPLASAGCSWCSCGFGSDFVINTSVLIFPHSNLSWARLRRIFSWCPLCGVSSISGASLQFTNVWSGFLWDVYFFITPIKKKKKKKLEGYGIKSFPDLNPLPKMSFFPCVAEQISTTLLFRVASRCVPWASNMTQNNNSIRLC